jgi:hypothetical protein
LAALTGGVTCNIICGAFMVKGVLIFIALYAKSNTIKCIFIAFQINLLCSVTNYNILVISITGRVGIPL